MYYNRIYRNKKYYKKRPKKTFLAFLLITYK